MRRALIPGLMLALVATGCSGGPLGEDPLEGASAAAESLASGLQAGDVGATPYDDATAATAAEELPEVLGDLADAERAVTVADVSLDPEDDAAAQAVLTWSWTVGDQVWTYDTTAPLADAGGEWQAAWSRTLVEPSLGAGDVLDASSVPARRADIIGAGGEHLVTSREVRRVGINREGVPRAVAVDSARELARLVEIDVKPYVRRVRQAGDRAFVEAITYRAEDVPIEVAQRTQGMPAVLVVATTAPLGPSAEFAAPILGRVGEVTAEMIEDDPDAYRPGDVAGLSGLSARYDEQLRGTPGVLVEAVAADGTRRELFESPPVRGTPVRITMDADLQRAAEAALSGVGPPAALVAIRPSDGHVLAAANNEATNGVNIATYGQAAPGSTFKIVSALALLRAGLTPDQAVDCPAQVVVDGKTFANYDDYPPDQLGRIPLRAAVAQSCNTAFIGQLGTLGIGDLAGAAASLGFGVDHDVGFPAYFGQVAGTTETERAAALIGQGQVLASPMAMATVMASASAGGTVVPMLVKGVTSPVPEEADPVTETEASALREMLRGVVAEGSGSGLVDVPGPPVLAKTGTAEFDRDGGRLLHAWMVAAQGDLAVAVYVDEGESGSRTAGPVLEEFLRAAR